MVNEQIVEVVQEKIYSTVEIAKRTRKELKETFPGCKFSVTTNSYSGGSSITIAIMSTPFKLIKAFEDIPKKVIQIQQLNNHWMSPEKVIEEIKYRQSKGYNQLNHYKRDEYDEEQWQNGVYLTKEGHDFIQRVIKIAQKYNWDNSDSQTDYFDVNYYLNLHIGSYDKPYAQVTK